MPPSFETPSNNEIPVPMSMPQRPELHVAAETVISSAQQLVPRSAPAENGPLLYRGLEHGRRMVAKMMAIAALAVTSVVGGAVSEHAPVAKADAAYPDSDAQDCSARYGMYSWCKSGTWISPRGYGYRNCTDWAAFRAQQLTGQSVPRGLGNARDWDTNAAQAGYLVDNTPNIGDIAVWDGGSMGHVEVVEGVYADGSVNTSGYNKRRDGAYGTQVRVRADHYIQIAKGLSLPGSGTTPAQTYPEAVPPSSMYGQGNLYFAKTTDTPSGYVEVHSATKRTDYQDSDLHQITRFSSADALNGTFQMVGRKLYFIKTGATGSGHVEIHTATESSGYSQADLAVATPFTVGDGSNGTFQMADINHDLFEDLVFIKTAATASGRIEVFAAYGGPGHFGSLSLAKPSAFVLGEVANGQFQIQNADLVFIKTRATESGMVEYFRAPISSDFTSINEATPTAFNAAEDSNGIFSSVDVNGDNGAELVFIKTNNTESGRIEVFAAAGQNYQEVILAKPTNIRVDQSERGLFQMDNKE